MASVPELEQLRLRKAQLLAESDALRATFQMQCADLEQPALLAERGVILAAKVKKTMVALSPIATMFSPSSKFSKIGAAFKLARTVLRRS